MQCNAQHLSLLSSAQCLPGLMALHEQLKLSSVLLPQCLPHCDISGHQLQVVHIDYLSGHNFVRSFSCCASQQLLLVILMIRLLNNPCQLA